MSEFIPTIGIETHVQLATKSKLFCSCSNDAREAKPNTLVCPVCMGFPGTLPVLNHQAVMLGIRAGLALNGEIAKTTSFDRKNYFYPDLPKGYQITQMDHPIVGAGHIEFPLNDATVKVGITRAHMEEDAGKLTHPEGTDYSLVDYNRTGTPLMEIVSEPDMHSAAEAKAYAQEIYTRMKNNHISNADLYYGNMRFDVNVSVAPEGERGTRTETKNLNSFKAVERAVEYEVKRQSELLAKGEKIVQETRGWDDAKGKTFSQRSKEDAHDYRYFPEPDLPPVVITSAMKSQAESDLTYRAEEVQSDLKNLDISQSDIQTLLTYEFSDQLVNLLKQIDKKHLSRVVNWMVGEVRRLVSEGVDITDIDGEEILRLSEMVDAGELSATAAKAVLAELVAKPGSKAAEIAERLNLTQVSDSSELERIVSDVITANPVPVADYKAGNERALQALVGQVMKASKGQANPAMARDILGEMLKG